MSFSSTLLLEKGLASVPDHVGEVVREHQIFERFGVAFEALNERARFVQILLDHLVIVRVEKPHVLIEFEKLDFVLRVRVNPLELVVLVLDHFAATPVNRLPHDLLLQILANRTLPGHIQLLLVDPSVHGHMEHFLVANEEQAQGVLAADFEAIHILAHLGLADVGVSEQKLADDRFLVVFVAQEQVEAVVGLRVNHVSDFLFGLRVGEIAEDFVDLDADGAVLKEDLVDLRLRDDDEVGVDQEHVLDFVLDAAVVVLAFQDFLLLRVFLGFLLETDMRDLLLRTILSSKARII